MVGPSYTLQSQAEREFEIKRTKGSNQYVIGVTDSDCTFVERSAPLQMKRAAFASLVVNTIILFRL